MALEQYLQIFPKDNGKINKIYEPIKTNNITYSYQLSTKGKWPHYLLPL